MSSTEALHSFLRWRKIMKMFCSTERSCKLLLQESFCNFSFKDFSPNTHFPLFFSFPTIWKWEMWWNKASKFLFISAHHHYQPSPSGIVNDCREKASNSQVSRQEKHFGLSWIFHGRNYLQSFDVNPCTLKVDFVHCWVLNPQCNNE